MINKKQIPEGEWKVMNDKIIFTHNEQVLYVSALSNPFDDAIINNEYIELKLHDYYTDEFITYTRPSDLLDYNNISPEALIKIIMWQSKIIRELNEMVHGE